MSKYLNPKWWYLAGVGAAALAAEGARRLLRRRRRGEPVIPEDVSAAVESKTRQAKAKGVEVEAELEDTAESVVKPIKKAASQVKTEAGEAAEKVESVVKSVKKAPARVKDAAGEATDAVEEAVKKTNGVPAAEFVKARTAKAATPAPKTNDAPPDDLTEIKGIGPTFAKRLAEAGITTFADVAAASPDHLREVTHATAVADPEAWIAQARAK
jgi:predicted flap endonuclease-1-like 5' DNA nuclease